MSVLAVDRNPPGSRRVVARAGHTLIWGRGALIWGRGALIWGLAALAVALVGLSPMLSACGGGSLDDGTGEACTSSAECGAGSVCEDEACVDSSPAMATRTAGLEGCAVLSCPAGVASCCRAISAGASGNEGQDYAAKLDLLDAVSASRGAVTATFSFREAEQQGWVAFDLGAELELSRVFVVASQSGVAEPFMTLSTNQPGAGGCAFAFDLEATPAIDGSLGSEIELEGDDFCSSNASPGRASELVFGVFAAQAGEATLTISGVELKGE